MINVIFIAPVLVWFLSLFLFLLVMRKENPEAYHELGLFNFFRSKKSDDAARVMAFFLSQKHKQLGKKTALAGQCLNVIFILCGLGMLIIFGLGWTGRLESL